MRIHPALILLFATLAPAQIKRPMTFEDMMHMRRLGETDVSPDGKWLIYSVTDVDLAQNTRIPKLWIQEIGQPSEPKILEGTQPNDSDAHFSHDGKHILFLSSRGPNQQIWTADFDPNTGKTSNVKTLSPNIPDLSPTVKNQSPTLPNQSSNDANQPSSWSYITAKSLIPENPLWSPDTKFIVFTAEVYPDCPAITPTDPAGFECNYNRDQQKAAGKVKARIFDHLLYRHWSAFTGDKRSHLFSLAVDSGAIRDLTPNDPHDTPPFSLGGGGGFAISPDSRELAFTENLDEEPAISTNADIFTLDLTNPSAKPVKISTSPGGDFSPSYSPDGKYLAWRSQARAGYESDKFRLLLYDRVTKSTKDLLPNFDRWVDEFAWAPNSNRLYLTSEMNGISQSFIVALDSNVQPFYSIGTLSDLHPLADNQTVILTENAVTRPSNVTWIKAEDPSKTMNKMPGGVASAARKIAQGPITAFQVRQLTNLNGKLLGQLDLSQIEDFHFIAADGTKVQGFLIHPPNFDSNKKYPVKFLIHGGPQGAWGDSWSYRWNAELLAANGYVVLMINPRGSTGYGQAFVDGVNNDWGGKPFSDLMLGLDAAERQFPFIDKDRECALGASYGGYMADWILGHTNRFKCIVTHDGMFNPESAYGTTDELWFNEWEFKGKPWDYDGKPDNSNPYRKWSPMLSANNFKTPTLVIHSQLDYRLDVSEGYQLFTTLQRLKVPSKMLYFPDESHWVQKPQNSQLWYQTVNAWVDQWTK